MALIRVSGLISDIIGKIGGTVFQRTQGGLTARNQSAPINSNTLRSNKHKVNTVSIQSQWQLLTIAERNQWSTYATFLNKKQKKNPNLSINGHQLFINVNAIRYDMTLTSLIFQPPLLSTPTMVPVPLPISIVTLVINFGQMVFTLSRNVLTANDVIILYLSRPLTASQTTSNVKTILMKSSTIDGPEFDPTSYYETVYGRKLIVGEWVQTRIAIWDTTSNNYSSFDVQRVLTQ